MPTSLFGRDPVVILELVKHGLAALAVFAIPGFDPATQALVLAGIYAVLGAIQAAQVRPIAPAAFVTLIQAGAALSLRFGVEVTPEHIAAIVALLSAVLALQVRSASTPAADPRPLVELGGH